jgi:hypothetical protein
MNNLKDVFESKKYKSLYNKSKLLYPHKYRSITN